MKMYETPGEGEYVSAVQYAMLAIRAKPRLLNGYYTRVVDVEDNLSIFVCDDRSAYVYLDGLELLAFSDGMLTETGTTHSAFGARDYERFMRMHPAVRLAWFKVVKAFEEEGMKLEEEAEQEERERAEKRAKKLAEFSKNNVWRT